MQIDCIHPPDATAKSSAQCRHPMTFAGHMDTCGAIRAHAREQTWGQLGILTQPVMHPACRQSWDSAGSVPAKFQVKCLHWGHLPRPCSEMRAARGQKLQNSAMHGFKNHRI